MGGREAEQALALEDVFQRLAEETRALGQLVDRHRARLQPIGVGDDIVVLQILADARQVGDHRYALLAQQIGRPDAGKLQQLRRVDRPAAENHLGRGLGRLGLAVLDVFDAHRPLALEQDPRGQRVGLDAQVRPVHHRVQIGDRGRAALAVLHGQLVIADAFLLGAVDVWIARNARLDAGLDDIIGNLVGLGHVRDVERPASGVVLVGVGAFLVLRAQEIGAHVVPGPAVAAQLAPAVIVGMLAADIEQAVDRGRAAQHLAARPDVGAAGDRVRLGRIEPVDLRVLQRLGIAYRHVDHQVGHELAGVPGRPVVAAGFQQQHPGPAVRGQPVGQHAARRSRSHHDVVGHNRLGHDAFP